MISVFISQPMAGRDEDTILAERNAAIAKVREIYNDDVGVISTYFKTVPYSKCPDLYCLGKAIMMLAEADLAVFCDGWQTARGCIIEHECAKEYGIKILELDKKDAVRGFERVVREHFEGTDDEYATIVLPKRGTAKSAGYDFVAPCDFVVPPKGYSKLLFSGVKALMPDNEYLALNIRSSIATKKHLVMANTVGIIDADYYGNRDNDGNIGMMFYNVGEESVTINKGERIAQGIFHEYKITDDDDAVGERMGGYGSTGQ